MKNSSSDTSLSGHLYLGDTFTQRAQTLVPKLKTVGIISVNVGGVAGIFQRGWGGWGHTVSHPGYLPDCRIDIRAVFY